MGIIEISREQNLWWKEGISLKGMVERDISWLHQHLPHHLKKKRKPRAASPLTFDSGVN